METLTTKLKWLTIAMLFIAFSSLAIQVVISIWPKRNWVKNILIFVIFLFGAYIVWSVLVYT